ncbi:MAG TPA: two-component regulator propeller domain-containing protein [Bacteroidales bacterium]|nr:two-component regulator propeller domain-containing protein [Bacteroidales bacterium]
MKGRLITCIEAVRSFLLAGLVSMPIWFAFPLRAQNQVLLTHFTTDQGLSQNTVVSVHKDQKGLMWFGTWDGLNKFDGYRFTVYKGNPNPLDQNSLLHTRIDWIREDKSGNLWLKTYDDLLYRFSPSTERFVRVTKDIHNSENGNYDKFRTVWVLDNGDVWCALQKGGLYRVTSDPKTDELNIEDPFPAEKRMHFGQVNLVFMDSEGTTWVLSDKGIARQLNGEKLPTILFREKTPSDRPLSQAFYCKLETRNELYFGAASGKLLSYNRSSKTFRQIQTAFHSQITSLLHMPDGRFFAASVNEGFFIFNPNSGQTDYYDKQHYPGMRSNVISDPYIDKYGEIWMSINEPGVLHFIPKTKSFEYLWQKTPFEIRNASQQTSFFVFEDAFMTLWVHSKEGTLFSYDRTNHKLKWFYNNPADPACVFKTNIQVAWADPEGILWVCAGSQGIYKCVQRNRDFHFESMERYIHSGTADIRSLFRDRNGNIWVGSKAGELRIMNAAHQSLGVLCRDGSLRASGDMKLAVYNILQDKKGRIWLATKGQGLVLVQPKTKTTFKLTFFNRLPGKYDLPSNNLYDLYEDHHGRLWIASYEGGLILMDESGGKFHFLSGKNELIGYPTEACPRVRCIDGDKNGNIWVGTTNGFLVFSDRFKKASDIKFYHYNRDSRLLKALNLSDIYQLLCDSQGNVWFGTFGGGLIVCKNYKLGETPDLQGFDTRSGFYTDIVLSLTEDNQHKLWLTSENVLARFDPVSKDCDRYSLANGLDAGDFLESSVYRSADGKLLFGNSTGFYDFSPEKVKRNSFAPSIALTRLQIFGRDAIVGGEDSPLKISLDDCTAIKLTHLQRTFSVEFSALDFQTPENIQYAYKLEGFEENWNTLQKARVATYTSVPHGNYTLLVKCTNSDGVWSNQIRKLEIVVLPSFWQTIWAYLLYIILAVLAVWGILRLLYVYLQLKNDVMLEQQISDIKLRFFTDISHELRTPMTLISAPLEHLLKEEDVSDPVRHQLLTMQRNTDRMSRLLNQILDFRKVQNKKMRLRLQESHFAECVQKTCLNFEEIAREKHIRFNVEDESNGILVWLDPNNFDTIVFNLLSNAFKFTPAEKAIRVRLSVEEGVAVLQVIDEGIGIDKNRLNLIFDRFYSGDEGTDASKRSTGIGLSLVKELVELHGATISVDSKPNLGTTFEVRFKLGVAHFGNEVDFILSDEVSIDPNLQLPENEIVESASVNREDMHMVLIVEDNPELRPFLRTVLGRKYRVAEAADGEAAWEMTQSLLPDFIITDLMMPKMSGNEFVRLVKNDDRTCHIPVVVLTAMTNMESKLECLNMGADDYITKPFSATFLEARVSNLLEQRRKLQSVYRDRFLLPNADAGNMEIEVPMPQAHSRDDEFMQRLMAVMEKNISNGAFSVEQLCSMAGYGRTVFFNKLKSLTGLSPNEYIREVRIKRASQLLEVGEYTVSQITYMVGMNDSRYFSKCFKQRYGMTPTEYRDKNHSSTASEKHD